MLWWGSVRGWSCVVVKPVLLRVRAVGRVGVSQLVARVVPSGVVSSTRSGSSGSPVLGSQA